MNYSPNSLLKCVGLRRIPMESPDGLLTFMLIAYQLKVFKSMFTAVCDSSGSPEDIHGLYKSLLKRCQALAVYERDGIIFGIFVVDI